VTVEEIRKLVTKAPSKHCQRDPIPVWLLKQVVDQLAPVLTVMCNTSLTTGKLPSAEKHALVTARLKKPTLDLTDLNSYRPISNLSFTSKLVERCVAARFVAHCEQNRLFPDMQSAYRRHHSTETAVLTVHNDIIQAIDRGQLTALVLLDLSSAFDTVDHTCLLTILQNRFSVDATVASWFQSYLSDRTQTFSAGRDQSPPVMLYCSVPQGSALGPVQFIAYTEDVQELFDRHHVKYHLFADDKQVYISVQPREVAAVRRRLADCIVDLQAWCASRRLQLNTSKTELIWFGSQAALRQSSPADRTLSINDVVLQPAGVVRDLGVLLDNQLTMKQHVNRVASSCFFHLRRLRQIKRHVTPEAMNQLVAAVILGRLDYCNAVLAGLPWSTVAPLQRVQNAAARLVLGLSPRDHVSSALVELHWLPVCYRIQFKLGVLMYMAHNGQSPTYISDTLTPVSRGPARGRLRSADTTDYLVPRTRSKLGERAFCVSGPLVWNSLPESLRTVDCITTFRRRLKTHFFNLYLS